MSESKRLNIALNKENLSFPTFSIMSVVNSHDEALTATAIALQSGYSYWAVKNQIRRTPWFENIITGGNTAVVLTDAGKEKLGKVFELIGHDPKQPPAQQEGEEQDLREKQLAHAVGDIIETLRANGSDIRSNAFSCIYPILNQEVQRELSAKQAEVERLNKLLQKRICERNEKSWRLHKLETLVGPYVQWDEESDYPSFIGELESLKAAQGWRKVADMKPQEIQDGIDATHPWSKVLIDGSYEADEVAMNLIHGRHDKREIVNMLRWILMGMPLPTPPAEKPPTGEENE